MDRQSSQTHLKFPLGSLPNRTKIYRDFDKAISAREYSRKFNYSLSQVNKLCLAQRLDCLKILGRWYILPNPPALWLQTIRANKKVMGTAK